MTLAAVLALHWQVNVVKPEGFFGGMLAGPVARGGVIARAVSFHDAAVFVTGVATNLTVEQTARHGTDLGFTVHPVSDCVTAATEDAHRASLASLDLVTAGSRTAAQLIGLFR